MWLLWGRKPSFRFLSKMKRIYNYSFRETSHADHSAQRRKWECVLGSLFPFFSPKLVPMTSATLSIVLWCPFTVRGFPSQYSCVREKNSTAPWFSYSTKTTTSYLAELWTSLLKKNTMLGEGHKDLNQNTRYTFYLWISQILHTQLNIWTFKPLASLSVLTKLVATVTLQTCSDNSV